MVRSPTVTTLLLFIALGALAVVCSAQTPPPDTGDWVIADDTQFRGANVSIDGSVKVVAGGELILRDSQLECINISVSGGRLELLRTDVTLTGSMHSVLNASSGTYLVTGGSITSTGMEAILELASDCILNATTVTGMETVRVSGWNAAVLNSTIRNCQRHGLTVYPIVLPTGSIHVSGNRIIGPGQAGIHAYLNPYSGETVLVSLADNEIVDPGGSGISLITHIDAVRVELQRNRIKGSVDHGVFAYFRGSLLMADLSGTRVEDAGMDGIRMVLEVPSISSLRLANITSVNNSGFGISVFSLMGRTSDLRFDGLNASQNGDGGVKLSHCPDAELWDSTVMNPDSTQADYVMIQSSLSIHNTVRRRAGVLLADQFSSVVSLRRLDLTARWQDGSPVAYRRVSLMDGEGNVMLSLVTDGSGRLGVCYVWDWRVTPQGAEVRWTFRLVLSGDGWDLRGDGMPLKADLEAVVVLVDDIPPVLVVDRPVEGLFTNTIEIVVEGTCTDPQTAVALVQVSIDDDPDWEAKVWHGTLGLGSWRHTFSDLPDGTYNVYVRAYDVQNHPGGMYTQVVVRDVTVDTVAPWLSIEVPEDGTLTNDPGLEVRGTVEDGATVTVNGSDARVTDGAFETWVLLLEGPNRLEVVATDEAGNINTVNRDVVLDTIPPFLTVEGGDGGRLWVPVDGRQVNGTTEPGTRVTFTVDGSVTQLSVDIDGGFVFWMEPLDDGAIVTLEAIDAAGNVARSDLMVDLGDDIPPVLTVHRPLDGTILNTGAFRLEGNCVDPQGVALVQVSIDGVPDWDLKEWRDAVGTDAWSYSFDDLPDGTYDLYVRAFDSLSGTIYSRVVVEDVTVDTMPPWLDVFDPVDGELTNRSLLQVRGSVETGATVTIAGAEAHGEGGTFVASVLLSEGPNEITIQATDVAGNVRTVVRTVVLDTVSPFLALEDLVEGRLPLEAQGQVVTGRTEPGSRLTFLVRGSLSEVPVEGDGSFAFQLPILEDGTRFLVEATDAAGNSVSLTFVVDLAVENPSIPGGPPLIAISAVILGTMAVLGALLTVESFRYSALLVLMPLYARMKRDKVLDNKVRYLLHGIIIDNPGIHYRALMREFGLSNGISTYHLNVLEREGFIRSVRDGRLRRFYSIDVKVPRERRLPPGQLSARIRRLVEETPGISQKRIIEELGVSRRAAGYHLEELVSKGELQASRDGRNTVYRIRPRKEGARSGRKVHGMGARELRSDAKAKTTNK